MSKSIIFYFSGTGNSLVVAEEIKKNLSGNEVISMGDKSNYRLTDNYEYIGFVYPTYFGGIPLAVSTFISTLDFGEAIDPYIFAVTTFGGMTANSLKSVNKILLSKGRKLNYGNKLQMFSNFIIMYDMSEDIMGKTKAADENLKPILKDIKSKIELSVGNENPIVRLYYNLVTKKLHFRDKNFIINSDCNGCGICEKVCPVKNIEMIKNKPTFKNKCEQCTACIQFCPQKALNYKNITQKRKRYTNPKISYKSIAEKNNQ